MSRIGPALLHVSRAAFCGALGLFATMAPAAAQGWFDQLFRPYQQPAPVQQYYYRRPPPRHRPPRPHPTIVHLVDKTPEKIGKDVTFVTAVLGDSLGQLLGVGLADALSDKPEIGVLRRGRENTGLTRDDVFDWVKGTQDLLAGPEKISAAVMFVGSNDRQSIREGDAVHEPFTPRWIALYRARVAAIDAQFKARGVPLIWLGLPVVRSERLATDFAKLNDLYREEAGKSGATFVDTWEAFADERGQYSPVGPGTDGQVVRLRTADGVHFTRAGTLKLAHFIEGDIRNDLGARTPGAAPVPDAVPVATPAEPAPAPEAAPVAQKPAAGPVLSLTGPPAANDGLLARRDGAKDAGTLADTVLARGRAPDSRTRELTR